MQVFISYGKKSNGERLLSYGFVPREGTNPRDSVEVPVSLSKSDKCYKEKLEVLRKHGLSAWLQQHQTNLPRRRIYDTVIEEEALRLIPDTCEASISKYDKFLQASGSMDLDVASPKQLNRRLFLKQLAVDLSTSERRILFRAQHILRRRLRDIRKW
ncbi:ribulose-1,5 bisphosphate carboxylase/oxygenase large subunit N-methyltransferase [Pyrus ussuriensis x Pyrus communis]|uniref:Ribulose-1,5 bisphosphate carboxylase/oxygenase large subunit N-methyltransferase n=1 Tax=Pyrus ussuriensis x Pyrus communis TaxID=2448454 RepID=A0A5N5GGI1_9ROSA|nr:ribulose-1,5 bisphosphate carboxylase/oxygenase large subunit N-methyltransferase [Pyrus ussuriensis x Pyrus communis]